MEYLLIPACFIAAVCGSSIGFGGAMSLAPACFFLLPPAQAVLTTALLTNLSNLLIITERREKHFALNELSRMAITTLPGMIIGVFILKQLNEQLAVIIAGSVILLGVGLRLILEHLKENPRPAPKLGAYPIGLCTGILTMTVGFGALPPVWFLLRRVSPSATRDSLNAFGLGTGCLALILGILVIGIKAALPPVTLLFLGAAAILLGQLLGRKIFERLSGREKHYQHVAMIALAIIAIASILHGVLTWSF